MPDTQTPLERAARALRKRDPGTHRDWVDYLDDARAVLMALREASGPMMAAGARVQWWEELDNGEEIERTLPPDTIKPIFQAMIDAAMTEGEG